MGFYFIFCMGLIAQNKSMTDSLELIYKNGQFDEKDQLNNLRYLARYHTDQLKRIGFSDDLIKAAKAVDSVKFLWSAYIIKGHALNKIGDLNQALKNYLLAADIAIDLDDEVKLISTYISIANAYSNAENHENTVSYYLKAIEINKIENKPDSLHFAIANLNLSDEYLLVRKPDSAMIYLLQSKPIFESLGHQKGIAYTKGNIGIAYVLQGKHDLAEQYMDEATIVHKASDDVSPICIYLIHKADIYIQKNDLQTALGFAQESLDLAKDNNLKNEISEANLKLADIYELLGNTNKSLKYYKDHITFRDSIHNVETVQQMGNMRTNFEVSQKQTEVDLLNQQKTNQRVLIFSMIAFLGMIGLYFRNISKEKRRSDELLLNILPSGTAEELKESGKVKAKKFDSISVMFTDFQAFTKYSQKLSPEVLVQSVDYYFSKFDEIIDKHGLEKIKTIGDAYMCAGGLPIETKDHPEKIINAAFEISNFIQASKDSNLGELAHFNIRIGINTGPVVAGVVGSKKFAYDIWGDTVNVASRMESNSKEGKINISHNTYLLIKDDYDCEYRGEINVKNKGMMKMYYVNSRKDPSPLKVNSHKRQLKIIQDQNISV